MSKEFLYDLYTKFKSNKKVKYPDIIIVDESKYTNYWAQVNS